MQANTGKGLGTNPGGPAVALPERGRLAWDRAGRGGADAGRRFGYLVGALVNAVLLYLVSSPLVWRIPFLTESLAGPLAVIELSLIVSVVANLAFVVYDGAWFRHLGRMGMSAIAFAATYTLLSVFPFAFDNVGVEVMVRLSLLIALVGTAIAFVVELFKLLFGWVRD